MKNAYRIMQPLLAEEFITYARQIFHFMVKYEVQMICYASMQ